MATPNELAQEILDRLNVLSEQDQEVFADIPQKGPIDPCRISANLYVLPSAVKDSLEKIQELGFLTPDPKSGKNLSLNPNGLAAQAILKVLNR